MKYKLALTKQIDLYSWQPEHRSTATVTFNLAFVLSALMNPKQPKHEHDSDWQWFILENWIVKNSDPWKDPVISVLQYVKRRVGDFS